MTALSALVKTGTDSKVAVEVVNNLDSTEAQVLSESLLAKGIVHNIL